MKKQKRIKTLEKHIGMLTFALSTLLKLEFNRVMREQFPPKPAKPAEPEAPRESA
jgi:hypothetical protein